MKGLLCLAFALLFSLPTPSISHSYSLSPTDWKYTGDGFLTYDSNTGLEWLDLTQTAGRSYSFVQGQLAQDGLFDGFTIATKDQVREFLFQGAGITVSPSDLGTWKAENGQATLNAITLLGATYVGSFDIRLNAWSKYDQTSPNHLDGNLFEMMWTKRFGESQGWYDEKLIQSYWIDSGPRDQGVWLVRGASPVPEPSTVLLFGSSLFGLAWYRWKRKKT